MDNAFQDLKYPWMVAILDFQVTYSEGDKQLPQACGGTLGELQKNIILGRNKNNLSKKCPSHLF